MVARSSQNFFAVVQPDGHSCGKIEEWTTGHFHGFDFSCNGDATWQNDMYGRW